jgi:hypothetical protein
MGVVFITKIRHDKTLVDRRKGTPRPPFFLLFVCACQQRTHFKFAKGNIQKHAQAELEPARTTSRGSSWLWVLGL